ncbi:MAG: ADP-ribosylglycohydrolase family protein [Thermodesulfobacteriota bacterium]
MKSENNINSTTLEKFKGAFTFSAVGDALGWPTEFGRYPREVEKRFGRRYLENYVPWQKVVGGKFWGYREIIKGGEYSDDTQLSLAVYRCIDELGDFDPNEFAYFELPLWLHYERGGGKTIKTAARKLNQTTKDWTNNFYFTKEISYRAAGANGAAMRVLPIALVNFNNEKRLYRDAFINSIITHGHPRAILGSVIFASAVNFLLKEAKITNKTFLDYLCETVNSFSNSFKGDDLIQKWVYEWDKDPLNGMKFKDVFQKTRNEAIEYLQEINEKINLDDEEYYKITGALSEAYKGSGISTVLVAIYLFIKYIENPQKGILRAVNMLGSDTDTIAVFLGGLFGAYYGLSAVPINLLERLQDREYIIKAATHLHDIVIGEVAQKYLSSKTFDRYDAYLKIMAWEIGLHEMFWDALKEGEAIMHPALGRGIIKSKRIEPLRREDYIVKLIEIGFECGQTCVFHSRVSKNGELSESLAQDTNKILDSLEREGEATRTFAVTSLFNEVKGIYDISEHQKKKIEGFLERYKYLYPILKEAKEHIISIFGEDVKISLELHHDPQENWDELFVIIRSTFTSEEAVRLENRLAEEWFLTRMKETKGRLNIIEEPL